MNREYYISRQRMNARISDTVIPGMHINVKGYEYERVSKAPVGRRIVSRLLNEETKTRITIYA